MDGECGEAAKRQQHIAVGASPQNSSCKDLSREAETAFPLRGLCRFALFGFGGRGPRLKLATICCRRLRGLAFRGWLPAG